MDTRRGRPRHPDILTPKQWEVLDYIRAGLSDQDIADRLGVSRDGAKYHVSEILSKLGVTTREEAASWQPEERRVHGRFDRWLAGAVMGAGMSVGAAAVGGIALLGWGVVNTSTTEANVSIEHAKQAAEQRFSEEIEFGQMTFVRAETITWEEWYSTNEEAMFERRVALHIFFEPPAEGCPWLPGSEEPCSIPPLVSPDQKLVKVTYHGYIYLYDTQRNPKFFDMGGCRELEILVTADTGELVYETYELLQPPYPPAVCDTVPPTPIRPD
ncbi:MAG: helix-turn-helix transcriptional regulator [Dehalococcoidia bacterium]